MNPEEILISTLSNIGYDIMKYIGKDLYNKIISYLEGNTNKRQIKNTAQILKYYADERQKYQSGYNEDKEEIDDDWFAYWHERSKLVSDKDLQGVWAKILNTELNSQGSVSKKTLEYLSIAEKLELEMFSNLSQFEVCISGNMYQPVILYQFQLMIPLKRIYCFSLCPVRLGNRTIGVNLRKNNRLRPQAR